MTFKKLIFVFVVTITIVVMSLWSFSYAWYAATNASTPFNTTTASFDTGVAVIFAQSQNINITTGLPIDAADVETKAGSSSFSIYADSSVLSGYAVAATISFEDIILAPELQNADFKYQLLRDGVVIGSGTGVTIGNNTSVTIDTRTLPSLDTTYSFTVRVWLEESNVSQNSMMGKTFSAKIKVATAMRK